MPTETPTIEPKTAPVEPKREEPKVDPERRLNPDTLCPVQVERIIEITRRIIGE